MIFNGGRFNDVYKALIKNLYTQTWDDAGINPPPPGSDVRITDGGDNRITDSGDIRITD